MLQDRLNHTVELRPAQLQYANSLMARYKEAELKVLEAFNALNEALVFMRLDLGLTEKYSFDSTAMSFVLLAPVDATAGTTAGTKRVQ